MAGRGRGHSHQNPAAEAAYLEYLRIRAEAEAEEPLTRLEHDASGSSDSLFSSPSSSSPRSNVSVPSRARARGTALARLASSELPFPGLPLPRPHAAGAERTTGTDLDPTFQRLTLGQFHESSVPTAALVPLPDVRRGRGRGRGTATVSTPEPGISRVSPQIGVEDFAAVEKEVVVRIGEKGLPIALTANFIRLSVEEGRGLFEYHVDFDPPLESVRTRRWILRNHDNLLGNVRNFDGASLYLPFQLPQNKIVVQSQNPNDTEQMISITFRFVKKQRMGESVHFYNVLFRRIMEKLGMLEVNRQYYDYRSRYALPQHKMEIWPGYVTAVDELEGGLLLCCDVSHRVLRTSTLLSVYNDMYFQAGQNREALKQLYSDYVIGQVVLTRYNNRNYRVDDVAWNLNPNSTFELSNGEKISYVDYYHQQYDIVITDLEQPLLVHRPKPKLDKGRRKELGLVCLIPECTYMTGMTSELVKNHKVMKDIAEHTRLNPDRRRLALSEYVAKVKGTPEAAEILRNWGLTLEDGAIELPGRMIAPPNIILNSNLKLSGKSEFDNDVSRNPCLQPIPISNWIILFLAVDRPKADVFIQTYRVVCRNIGIDFRDPRQVPVHGPPNRLIQNYSRALMESLDTMKNLQLVVVVVPSEIAELYSTIKRICCLERPIASQVLLSRTLGNSKQLRCIVAKVALQINCKLGGALWTIQIPLAEKIMFVGMDVYHDPKMRSASVLALVASLNTAQTNYYSRIVQQRTHQEVGTSLRNIFADCLNAYRHHSGDWPDRIIVFRDGVGDGQLEMTKEAEVGQMLSVLHSLCPVIPKFTFAVVQKRIACRLYAAEPNTVPRRCINPPPGTILDHTVTRRYLFDFFLVSQLVRQGTVSPTHYVVVEDNANIKPDLIQKFAFATSFLYYNWAGPVRVPAVCQYAHKLAFLVGQYIKDTPSDALSSKLYYL